MKWIHCASNAGADGGVGMGRGGQWCCNTGSSGEGSPNPEQAAVGAGVEPQLRVSPCTVDEQPATSPAMGDAKAT